MCYAVVKHFNILGSCVTHLREPIRKNSRGNRLLKFKYMIEKVEENVDSQRNSHNPKNGSGLENDQLIGHKHPRRS